MPERYAVVVEGLHEVFRVYHERPPGLKERLYRFRRSAYAEFHALAGVDLAIRHGETVALIGHNGSGKSTLLKCIAKILPADEGSVTTDGRVATLLELGAGFHEELSGRENIYLNGALLGLSRREIDASFDSIVDFSGVREFIDAPVRNYSSGMYVRLGFAIAVHVDPDILLVDEVLSVGDAAFQDASLARMRSFSQRGKTVVLVSHDLAAVRSLCDRTVVLDHGQVIFDGPTEDAIETYQRVMKTGERPERARTPDVRVGDFRARISRLETHIAAAGINLSGSPSQPLPAVPSGATARFTLEVTACDDLLADGGLSVGVHIRRPDMTPSVYETRTAWRITYVAPPPEGASLTATIDLDLALLSGVYLIDFLVSNASTNAVHDRWPGAVELEVRSEDSEQGVVPLAARIALHNPDGVWPAESLPPAVEDGGPNYHPLRDGGREPSGTPRGTT